MRWKAKILETLKKHGPMRSGELIALLRFDVVSTYYDVTTKFMDGLKPLHGSFDGSKAQRKLAKLVERNEVNWQRASNMDNWYGLPGQEFPVEVAVRGRTLKQLMGEVIAAAPDDMVDDEWKENAEAVESDDVWVEFCPFVLSMHEKGWELADGDPICNWCGNTFTEVYPIDVYASAIVDRMILAQQGEPK